MKKTTIIGTITTILGGIGTILASIGLCACTIAPILSITGIATIIGGFLTGAQTYLYIIGISLIITSAIIHKKKKTCKRHKK